MAEYERAWHAQDEEAVDRLFTEDARWRNSPYDPAIIGRSAIRALWAEDGDRPFTVQAEPVAVDGRIAVVRLEVRYERPMQEYRDLWLLRFSEDGRVEDYEEWPYWPGKGYTAD